MSDEKPERVPDNENVLRRIFSPYHINEDGSLKSSAFSPSSNSLDISVNREAIADFAANCEIGKQEERPSPDGNPVKAKIFRGCVRGNVGEIHNKHMDEEKSMYCEVLATPDYENNNPSHADLRLPKNTRGIRKKLADLFSNLLEPE
ncbi:hypothetical protein [Thalassospira profundimaris]|uniref:hypothetical protein n=1 Tax=Thalassospira profundimaris TaxID=502049 RepID=UPI0002872542|nr:hypothetical protein [Thalassospira profundimaris]EKF10192.1 hypothetical protein TH2_02460 [Thalassospira profundimaris WP0211]